MIRFVIGLIFILGGVGGMDIGPIIPSVPWILAGLVIMASPVLDGSLCRQLENRSKK